MMIAIGKWLQKIGIKAGITFAAIYLITGCSDYADFYDTYTDYKSYSIEGSISGLTQNGLTIQLNNNEKITLNSGESSFQFKVWYTKGFIYNITLVKNANNLNCSIQNQSGMIENQNITNILVQCIPIDYTSLFNHYAAGLNSVKDSSSDFGDIDNDNDSDIVITGSNTTSIYKNDGSGFFTIYDNLSGVSQGTSQFADLDNDSDLDLLVTGINGTRFALIYENDGNGNFSDVSAGFTGVNGSSCDIADIDQDHDLDLIITGNDGSLGVTYLYRNDGGLNFSHVTTSLQDVAGGSSVFGDFDGDADEDLLITGNNHAILYENDGMGNFTDIDASLSGVDNYSGGIFLDFDNDMNLDMLIVGRMNPNKSAILYKNNGLGIFTPFSSSIEGVDYASLAAADIDFDGDTDLVITGIDDSATKTSILYVNNGDGTFFNASAGLTGVWNGSVGFNDVDNDKDIDLLITGGDASNIETAKLYRNQLFEN